MCRRFHGCSRRKLVIARAYARLSSSKARPHAGLARSCAASLAFVGRDPNWGAALLPNKESVMNLKSCAMVVSFGVSTVLGAGTALSADKEATTAKTAEVLGKLHHSNQMEVAAG